jgi:hypothetical protein
MKYTLTATINGEKVEHNGLNWIELAELLEQASKDVFKSGIADVKVTSETTTDLINAILGSYVQSNENSDYERIVNKIASDVKEVL